MRQIVLSLCVVFMASTAMTSAEDVPSANYERSAEAINAAIRKLHYDPASLDNEDYRQVEAKVLALGGTAQSKQGFLRGFRDIWRAGPFSHVALLEAREPADLALARIDTQAAGADAVKLSWRDRTAILTVDTMSGPDTVEAINAAHQEIARRKARRLIIDLRANLGGAFAVLPLVGHLIDRPFDAGVFVPAAWYRDHRAPPTLRQMRAATPWQGYSVVAFQKAMLGRPLTAYRIPALRPHYAGPVTVLISSRSISAAEIAAKALMEAGRATVIGEKTRGICLSSTLVDIPGGFQLLVPIADYYSSKGDRLEGKGVTPDIEVTAPEALNAALRQS